MTGVILAPTVPDSAVDQLMNEVAAGDRIAFGELYAATSTRVFSLTQRMLINITASEEVTQTTYLEVWQLAARYDPARGGATTWILAMAHRHALHHLRSPGFSSPRNLAIGASDSGDAFDLFEEEVQTVVDYGRAKRALGRLSTNHREVLGLAYWHGLTALEIAEKRAVSVSETSSLLREALIALRTEWSRDFLAAAGRRELPTDETVGLWASHVR